MKAIAKVLPMLLVVVACGLIGFGSAFHPEKAGVENEENKGPLKGPELEQWYFSQWHYPYGNMLDPEMLDNIWREVKAMPTENDFALLPVNSWTQKGPFGMDVSGGAKYSGRVLDIENGTASSVRIAAASGGLWQFFLIFPVSMTEDVTSQAIGSFATDPTNQDVIVIGTGEPSQRSGTGMYRTTNGGASWNSVALSPNPSSYYRIRYTPGNPQKIHAASTSGYYRSDNGGTTWTRRYTGNTTDFVIDPSNANIIYMGVRSDGIYKSTNGGDNWTKLTAGGIPTTNIGRTGLTLCNATPGTVYASLARDDNSALLGVYKSTNGGTSWSDVSPTSNFLGNQGWYDNVIGVSPTDANIVLVGGVTLWRTSNGGTNWTQITSGSIHVDHHAISWKSDGTAVWNGNDGGFFYSADAGVTWSSAGNLMPITQYVNIDVDQNDARIFGGGSQDNGISLSVNSGTNWDFVLGGDGGGVAMDVAAGNPGRFWITNGVYGGSWAFRRLQTTNNGSNFSFNDNGIDPSGQWYHKIRHDRVAPVYLYNHSDGYVYESTDFGSNWVKKNATVFPATVSNLHVSQWGSGGAVLYASLNGATTGQRLHVFDNGTWFERSAGLTTGLSVRGVGTHRTDREKAYAMMNGFSSGNKVFKTTNRGQNWTNISSNLPNVAMGDLIPHPTDDDKLYLGTEMGCYRTTNAGASWHRWNNGMPEANIITEFKYIDSLSSVGRFYIVAGSYGRGMWTREVSGDDPVSVSERGSIPTAFELEQNFPNPFNPATTISYSLPASDRVEIKVYDVRGREVATLVDDIREAGKHNVQFDAAHISSGVYFYRIQTSKFSEAKKMTLLK